MNRSTRTLLLLSAILTLTCARTLAAQTDAVNACDLVTESEVQLLLGAKVNLKSGAMGEVRGCNAEGPTATMVIRLFRRTDDPSGAKETARIDAIRKMGARVDVKSSDGVTCMTTMPPPNMADHGFSTNCTVSIKAPMFATIVIMTKSQKDMVSMEKLRSVAEGMVSRF